MRFRGTLDVGTSARTSLVRLEITGGTFFFVTHFVVHAAKMARRTEATQKRIFALCVLFCAVKPEDRHFLFPIVCKARVESVVGGCLRTVAGSSRRMFVCRVSGSGDKERTRFKSNTAWGSYCIYFIRTVRIRKG